MSLIEWLYRYIFRGAGILLVIGILTGLFGAIVYVCQTQKPPSPPTPSYHR